ADTNSAGRMKPVSSLVPFVASESIDISRSLSVLRTTVGGAAGAVGAGLPPAAKGLAASLSLAAALGGTGGGSMFQINVIWSPGLKRSVYFAMYSGIRALTVMVFAVVSVATSSAIQLYVLWATG